MNLDKITEMIAAQLELDAAEIKPESRLVEDLKADSLDIVTLVMDIEQEFDVEIPDEKLPELQTVADIVAFLGDK